jgi:serine/threonine protein kinase
MGNTIVATKDTLPIKEGLPSSMSIDEDYIGKKGGFGEILVGHIKDADIPIVIKRQKDTRSTFPENKKSKFLENEIKALKTLNSKRGEDYHCITCLSFFTMDGDSFCMAFPLCIDSFAIFKSLHVYRYRRTRLILEFTMQITAALKFLHSIGIVHRDIKAENILLLYKNGKFSAIVADFGSCMHEKIDKRTDGTKQYLAPEIFCSIENSHLKNWNDFRMDYWALGVLVYIMLTGGKYPFINTDGTSTHVYKSWINWLGNLEDETIKKESLFRRKSTIARTGHRVWDGGLEGISEPRICPSLVNNMLLEIVHGLITVQPFHRWCSRQILHCCRKLRPLKNAKDINRMHETLFDDIKVKAFGLHLMKTE